MRIPILVSTLVCAALAQGQSFKTNWANSCFMNPASVVCKNHDFAIKPAKGGRKEATNAFSSAPGSGRAARIGAIDIDWRFADPQPDALAGFYVPGLSASPLGRSLIAQLAAKQNLSEADMQKIFEGLAGVDQIALSVRDNRVVVMVTGRVKELTLPPSDGRIEGRDAFGNHAAFRACRRGRPGGRAPRGAVFSTSEPCLLSCRGLRRASGQQRFWATPSGRIVGGDAVTDARTTIVSCDLGWHRLASRLRFRVRRTAEREDDPDVAGHTWRRDGRRQCSPCQRRPWQADVRQKFGRIVGSPRRAPRGSGRRGPKSSAARPQRTEADPRGDLWS